MIPIDLHLDGNFGMTLLSNAFIDNYMKYANEAEIKVYLYLLRNLAAGKGVDIASMADCFNYSEKDIMRALLYWERWGVLGLTYDPSGLAPGADRPSHADTLTGIRVLPLRETVQEMLPAMSAEPAGHLHKTASAEPVRRPQKALVAAQAVSVSDPVAPLCMSGDDPQDPISGSADTGCCDDPSSVPADRAGSAFSEASASEIKSAYTLDDMRAFREDASCSFLFTAAQQYLGRPLTDPQMRSLIYLTKELNFAPELTDYLLQYCIGDGHKDFRYIESTALGWAEQGISTPEEARNVTRSSKEDERIRGIMSLLGRNGTPAPQELRFIRRWINSYAFSMEIITEACNRAVSAVDRNRFAYAESILARWHEKGVRTRADVEAQDAEFLKSKGIPEKPTAAPRKSGRTDSFNRFEQREIDYDSIEHLLSGRRDKKD